MTDAAEAQEKNTATAEKLDATEGAIDQADERLGQLGEQNQLAQTQVAALTEGPGRMEAGASDLDAQARGIIDHSTGLECRAAGQRRVVPGGDARDSRQGGDCGGGRA